MGRTIGTVTVHVKLDHEWFAVKQVVTNGSFEKVDGPHTFFYAEW